MKPTWKKYLLYGSVIIIGGVLLFILVDTIKAKNTGFETKTLWDWMELLIIPFVLAIGAFYLNRSEQNTEHEIAKDRQQETALQAYLDRMSDLLLKENLQTTKKKNVRSVARTRTLTVLRGLDGRRKGMVLRFLYEAELIKGSEPIVNLEDSDLADANLVLANLKNVNLRRARLENAYFNGSDLEGANMSMTNLKRAILNGVNLKGANLEHSDMEEIDLSFSNLEGANMHAFMENANLKYANLKGANLETTTNIRINNNLKGANMEGVNLEGAKVTNEQLATVKNLKGATMPDGKVHD